MDGWRGDGQATLDKTVGDRWAVGGTLDVPVTDDWRPAAGRAAVFASLPIRSSVAGSRLPVGLHGLPMAGD
jgi:hypothetical protein